MTNIENCTGYQKLLKAVEQDESKSKGSHNYKGKLTWVIERANHYAKQTGLEASEILDAWESKRDYWYMNFYQDSNQPEIKGDSVRVFDTPDSAIASFGKDGFRCPSCGGISTSPYECDSGVKTKSETCDWKSYGLFGTLGKGVSVFVKSNMSISHIFMPIAWEQAANSIQPL